MNGTAPGRNRPQQRRSANKVDAILAAARRLLTSSPGRPSPRDLASAAGVSVGTLYRYFNDVDDVIDQVVVEHARHAESMVRELVETGRFSSIEEMLMAILQCYIELYREHPHYMLLLEDQELARRSEFVERRSDDGLVDLVIRSAVDRGVIDPDVAIAATQRLRLVWAACGHVLGLAFREAPMGDPGMLRELEAMAARLAPSLRREELEGAI